MPGFSLTRTNGNEYAKSFIDQLDFSSAPLSVDCVPYTVMGRLVDTIYQELYNAMLLIAQQPDTNLQILRSTASSVVFGPIDTPPQLSVSILDIHSEDRALAMYHRFANECFSLFDGT